MKKIISVLLALVSLLGVTSIAYAESDDELSVFNDPSYNHYRECDNEAGIIIEKYDTILNGENTVDYVLLATSLSEQKDDRIAAMNMIINIYNLVTEDERAVIKAYIKAYAPYAGVSHLQEFCNELRASTPAVVSSYSGYLAKQYAEKYYNNYNTAAYPNLDDWCGDCANFVSQCLLAGGMAMSGDWYIYRKNNVYNTPLNTTQLDYSWTLADPSPWISAKEFNDYWSDRAVQTYEYSTSEYESNHESIYPKISEGDVVQLLKKVLWWYEGYHTMLIYKKHDVSKDFTYAAHSNDTITSTILGNICSNSTYDSYHLKFFDMG